jgi:CBS domain-containing protein
MSTVRDIIRKKGGEVISISPDATVFEALQMMADHNTGALMVCQNDKVEGILSERDCVRRVDLENRSSRETRVADIMTSKVVYIEAGQPLEECMALMLEKSVRHLPVYDKGELKGLVSIRDVLNEVVDVQKFMISELEHYITGGGR